MLFRQPVGHRSYDIDNDRITVNTHRRKSNIRQSHTATGNLFSNVIVQPFHIVLDQLPEANGHIGIDIVFAIIRQRPQFRYRVRPRHPRNHLIQITIYLLVTGILWRFQQTTN